jgi:hypothetical protein
LTSLLRDPQSAVRVYLDGISPRLQASGGSHGGARSVAEGLGLTDLTERRLIVAPFPGADLRLVGTALDFRARIELGGFDPQSSVAAAGIAHLPDYVAVTDNGQHRAAVLAGAFDVAAGLLRHPSSSEDLDRAAIMLAHCERIVRSGARALSGSTGTALDVAASGQEFANELDPRAVRDVGSLVSLNSEQLESWRESIAGGERYEPNPTFAASRSVGGADADWMIGETLFDCKVYGALTVPKLRDTLRQLLGYVLLDTGDELGIRRVGMWLPRQRLAPTWGLLQLLGGDPEELLPSLREGFARTTGHQVVAAPEVVPLRRKHQLLADNRHTPYEMLARLALSDDVDVRRRVGRNAVTPEATVRVLAADSQWQAREGVAMNESTPDDVLAVLAGDRSAAVRRAVAANPGAPRAVLEALTSDRNDNVRWAARTNDGTQLALPAATSNPVPTDMVGGSSVQVEIFQDRPTPNSAWFATFLRLRSGSASAGFLELIPAASRRWAWQSGRRLALPERVRSGLPEDVLIELFRSVDDPWMRGVVADQLPISSPAVRELLLRDTDPEVRWRALRRTVSTSDAFLAEVLADLASSDDARLRFRTDGADEKRPTASRAAELREETLLLIARHPATPPEALAVLAAPQSLDSIEVLAHLVGNPSTRESDREAVTELMQTSRSADVRERLASIRDAPPAVLLSLASDRSPKVRLAVARNPDAPAEALSRLANSRDDEVRWSVLENSGTPDETVGLIADAMLRSEQDSNLLDVLKVLRERTGVHLPAKLIEAALDRLSKSRVRDPDIRVAAAKDDRCGARTLSRLARSANDDVRAAVAANRSAPPDLLERLAEDVQPRVRAKVAQNSLTPASLIATLSHDQEWHPRAAAAENPRAPQAVLDRLLADPDARVRSAAMKNASTPHEWVERVRAERAEVRERALPDRSTLGEMAANRRAEVRMEAAFSPAADGDLLVLLGGERSVQVKRAVAANPQTPPEVLTLLAESEDEQIRHCVALNGATPAAALAQLAGQNVELAILVGMNPDTPVEILDALAQDGDPIVRFVADSAHEDRIAAIAGSDPHRSTRALQPEA